MRVVFDPQGVAAVNATVATVFRVLHGCFAHLEFAVLVLLAASLGTRWEPAMAGIQIPGIKLIRTLGWVTFGFIFLQLAVGATIRHLGIGLVIPYFPKASATSWLPAVSSGYAHLHFTHSRLIALLILLGAVLLALSVLRNGAAKAALGRPTLLLLALISLQIVLGVALIWTLRSQLPTTLHVINGAWIFAVSLLLAVRATSLASSQCIARRVNVPHPFAERAAV
jgi:cytochrome c oxidase assembly protein subunit 15